MRYVKPALVAIFWIVVLAFLHYTLPQNDLARITDTYEKRVDFNANRWFWTGADGSETQPASRDVFFVQTRQPDGDVMVYRNEDTGWGWPPYFKFDSSNVQAIASDLSSTADAPTWVAITHYGWRVEFLSIYPNAMSIRQVEGPDVRLIPWTSIVILIVLAAVFWALWVRWRRFRKKRIAPMLQDVGDSFGGAKRWRRSGDDR